MTAATAMDAVMSSVQDMAKQVDEAGRKKLIDTLTGLIHSIEGPQDLMQRLLYMHVPITVLRIASDLQLFNKVVDSPTPMTAEQLAKACSAESPNLIARLMRYMASIGLFAETAPDTYTANKATKTLAVEAWQSAIYHNFDTVGPCYSALPEFLKETNYKDPQDPANCAFNKGHGVEVPAFAWFPTVRPDLFAKFNQFMTIQRFDMPTWLDKYPYQDKSSGLAPQQTLFVDVGGGLGHQSAALRKALPEDVTAPIVVQDQPQMVAQALQTPGVENTGHDFFTPQPIKGARIYYMRNIIHDWSDENSVIILRHIADAMAPDSVLLIDEMVVPDVKAHWQATQLDLLMMSALASCERTKAQWEALIPETGLKINKIYKYTDSLEDSIIECVKV